VDKMSGQDESACSIICYGTGLSDGLQVQEKKSRSGPRLKRDDDQEAYLKMRHKVGDYGSD